MCKSLRARIEQPSNGVRKMQLHRAFSRSRCRSILIELLVVITIIPISAAISSPVFARVREKARRASCQRNQKEIALGIFHDTQNHDEKHP